MPVPSGERSPTEDSWWPAFIDILPSRSAKAIQRPIKIPGCRRGYD